MCECKSFSYFLMVEVDLLNIFFFLTKFSCTLISRHINSIAREVSFLLNDA